MVAAPPGAATFQNKAGLIKIPAKSKILWGNNFTQPSPVHFCSDLFLVCKPLLELPGNSSLLKQEKR